MARTQVPIPTAIWTNPTFCGLPGSAQRLYLMLRTDSALGQTGWLPLTANRWASRCPDTTEASIRNDLARLAGAGSIVVDNRNEEIFIRSFMRDAGIRRMPNVWRGALAEGARITSPSIRAAFQAEIESLERGEPETAKARRRHQPHDALLHRTRIAVFSRDGFTCVHCGAAPETVPADYDGKCTVEVKKGDNVVPLHLGHVVPDVAGGPFTVNNLRAECETCNCSRGAVV